MDTQKMISILIMIYLGQVNDWEARLTKFTASRFASFGFGISLESKMQGYFPHFLYLCYSTHNIVIFCQIVS